MSDARQMSSGADVSRLLSEEQMIIDTVFQTCDVSHTGWVQVSLLVDCVKGAAGSQHSATQVDDDKLKLLVDLLDPSATNPKISMITYRSGISRWIKMLRLNEYMDEGSELSDAVGNLDGVLPESVDHSAGLFPASSSSCELSSTNDEYDTIELRNRLEYAEQQNRRLGEELSDLREQLNVADDTVAQLNQENGQLKHTLKCNQVTIDRFFAIRRENEELKSSLDGCTEEKKQLQAKLTKLEQANKNLSENVGNLQGQLSSARLEIESAEEETLNLHQQLNDKTLKLLSLEKTMEAYQLQLSNKNCTIEEVEKRVSALADVNKNLLKHSSEIEAQLAEKKELLHMQTVELTKRSFCDCFDNEIEDVIELMPFAPRHILPTPRQSTPQLRNVVSLHKELTSKIVKEPVFPSPLCDKELESLFNRSGESLSIITKDSNNSCIDKYYDDMDVNVNLSSVATTPMSAASKRYRKVSNNDHLKDSLTREVEGITEMAISRNMQRYKHTLVAFVDRMTACTDARIAAEQRNIALSSTLRQMQERMEEEGILHHLALQELENQLKSAAEDFESRLKQKNFTILLEKQRNEDLELRIMSLEKHQLSKNKASAEGENRDRESVVRDDQQLAPMSHPDNGSRSRTMSGNKAVERHVSSRLRDNTERFEATMKLLVALFREYQRCKRRSSMERAQLVKSTDDDDDKGEVDEKEDVQKQGDSKVGGSQQSDSDGYHMTTEMSYVDVPIASCCRSVISAVIFFAIILLYGLSLVKDHLGCGRTLWSAFEEIFRPHITLRHTTEPPV